MIDISKIRKTIATGLKNYLSCTVIRGNQTGEMPAFPYCVYNITTPIDSGKGTYEIYEDGTARREHSLTLSFTAHSDNYDEAVMLANKAASWLDFAGTVYLTDNDVIVRSVSNVTDRSNILTVEYDYSFGFDCFITVYDVITVDEQEDSGEIETAQINNMEFEKPADINYLNELLEQRLNGVI